MDRSGPCGFVKGFGLNSEGNGWILKGFQQDSGDASLGATEQTIDKRWAEVDTGDQLRGYCNSS